jgi:hypothetical protein
MKLWQQVHQKSSVIRRVQFCIQMDAAHFEQLL